MPVHLRTRLSCRYREEGEYEENTRAMVISGEHGDDRDGWVRNKTGAATEPTHQRVQDQGSADPDKQGERTAQSDRIL